MFPTCGGRTCVSCGGWTRYQWATWASPTGGLDPLNISSGELERTRSSWNSTDNRRKKKMVTLGQSRILQCTTVHPSINPLLHFHHLETWNISGVFSWEDISLFWLSSSWWILFPYPQISGLLRKKKVSRTLSPNPNILLASKINSRPIVCIHLLPTRKNSLSKTARGRESHIPSRSSQKKPLQSRPGSVNPSPRWLYSRWQGGWVPEKTRKRGRWLAWGNIIQGKLFPIWAHAWLVWPGSHNKAH